MIRPGWTMAQTMLLVVLAGSLARGLLPGPKPGVVVTLVAGLSGSLLGYAVGHEVLGLHEFHLFVPESLIPAVICSLVILVVVRRIRRGSDRGWLFR